MGPAVAEGKAVEGFKRINQTRTEQLLEVNPDTVIVNRPTGHDYDN